MTDHHEIQRRTILELVAKIEEKNGEMFQNIDDDINDLLERWLDRKVKNSTMLSQLHRLDERLDYNSGRSNIRPLE